MKKIEIDTFEQTVTFDGAICSIEALNFIFNPRPDRKYRFERVANGPDPDMIICHAEIYPENGQ